MITPHDPHPDDDLSEDERAFERTLAARLSHAGGPREPSAALDTAILAAARAAVASPAAPPAAGVSAVPAGLPAGAPQTSQPSSDPPAKRGAVVALPPRKPRPRWPLGLSLAASVVLAAGIGIKLYDGAVYDGGLSHDTAASAEAAAESAAFPDDGSDTLAEAILLDPPIERTPPPPPPPLENADAQTRQTSDGRSAGLAAAPQAVALPAEADAAAGSARIAAQPAPAASASSPAPIAAPGRPAPTASAADEAGTLDQVVVTGSRVDDARNVGAAEHTRTPLSERRREASEAARAAGSQRDAAKAESQRRQESAERRAIAAPPPAPPAPPPPVAAPPVPRAPPAARAGNAFVAEPPADKAAAEAEAAEELYDDRPPVSADSPEFRQAWLQRIRKLVTDGRRAEARASLLEFRRRYPEAAVPDDLRPLLTPEPAPPTP